jgi:hypothetical protein
VNPAVVAANDTMSFLTAVARLFLAKVAVTRVVITRSVLRLAPFQSQPTYRPSTSRHCRVSSSDLIRHPVMDTISNSARYSVGNAIYGIAALR